MNQWTHGLFGWIYEFVEVRNFLGVNVQTRTLDVSRWNMSECDYTDPILVSEVVLALLSNSRKWVATAFITSGMGQEILVEEKLATVKRHAASWENQIRTA